MNFHLNKSGQQLGPYTVDQIQIFLRQGVVSMDDHVWSEGWSSWMPIRSVPNIVGAAQPSYPGSQSVPVSAPVPQAHSGVSPDQLTSAYVQGKEPVVACMMSLIIVGTGQFYNGEWAKGWVLMISCIIAAWFSCGTFWLIWAVVSAIDAYRVAARLKTANNWNWWA